VLVTLGREGALLVRREGVIRQAAFEVAAVDTTAAGDAYMGAYAAAHLGGEDAARCLRFASAAAAVKVTRPGAQPGLPTRPEVAAFLAAHP
jgi:ribokinase